MDFAAIHTASTSLTCKSDPGVIKSHISAMVERAENRRELHLFCKKRLNKEEFMQMYKNRTPLQEKNALVASGDFKKKEPMMSTWKTKE